MDNQFFAGQVAMINRGHWIVQGAKRAGLNMDVAVVPAKESDTTVIGFGGYAVAKSAKDPELAQALVSALTSLETQTEEGDRRRRRAGPRSRRRSRRSSSSSRRAPSSTTRRCRTPSRCPRPPTSRRSRRSSSATTPR